MSRTSPSQFEVMVEFMERNGDLNKFTEGSHGRITAHNKWVELSRVLNLDTTGSSKTVDKWKKVWSDFKNNSKRKAAKIHRSASGTGGGPACRLVLSDLEQRVLNLTGTQAATGLINIVEVGVEQPPAEHDAEHQLPPPPSQSSTPAPDSMQVESMSDIENRPGPSHENRPGPSHENVEFHIDEIEGDALSPTPQHASVGSPRRSGAGARRVIRPRRRRRPPPPDAASHFLASEERWQNFATEFAAEHLRLREREIEQQSQWQTLFAKFINVLENKF